MKKFNVPILFFLSFILQIISCYWFLGKNYDLSFFLFSGLSTITATLLAYALVYYFSLDSGESRSNSEIKIGFTVAYSLIITIFILFLFLFTENKIYTNNLIAINSLILSIYGRQIFNKEIKKSKI